MALPLSFKSVEEEASCPICFEYLKDPVTLDCGHNFCRGCIAKYCEEWKRKGGLKCPLCQAKFQKGDFRSNWQLSNLVERIKQLSLSPGKGNLCLQHKEKFHLFCKEDNELLCFICEQSWEHRTHTVILMEEAAKEYKYLLYGRLELLKEEKTQILKYKEETEKESQDLLKQTKAEMEKMKTEFGQLHQFLEEQEKRLLAQLEEVEKEIARKREEHLARLSEELSSLGGLIQEMEQKCQQPPGELLMDVGRILKSCEKETFQNPVVFPPELKSKICDRNTFEAEMMKQFRGILNSGPQEKKANVTLDPSTAHPCLVLSEDLKSVRFEFGCQDLPDSPSRFTSCPFLLGCEGFTAGRHFWDVTVGSGGIWAVGVARMSVRRKGRVRLSTGEGIWALEKLRGCYRTSDLPDETFLPLSGKLRKIRVSLNYERGQVAFHDADTGLHLYTLAGASFSGETLLPFFYVWGKGSLIIP